MKSCFDQEAGRAINTLMKEQITDAVLKLAARTDWGGVQLLDIAKEAGLSLSQLRETISAKEDVIPLLFERLDKQMLDATVFEGETKDRLFDLFMARFDAMNANREAFRSILKSAALDPASLCRILPQAYNTMSWVMAAAGIDTQGLKSKPARLALMGVVVSAMRAWVKDDTPDLSAVMAKLDQGLDKISGVLR